MLDDCKKYCMTPRAKSLAHVHHATTLRCTAAWHSSAMHVDIQPHPLITATNRTGWCSTCLSSAGARFSWRC